MKKTVPFQTMILVIWALIMCASTAFTLTSPKETVSPYYDTMKEAALLAQRAMQAVRQYKVDHGIPISEEDILDTGMLGDRYTSITTTVGVLEAKRTTFNPNWAAVIVNMFAEAGLKEGDQVGMVFSGSFPALNICAMAAAADIRRRSVYNGVCRGVELRSQQRRLYLFRHGGISVYAGYFN